LRYAFIRVIRAPQRVIRYCSSGLNYVSIFTLAAMMFLITVSVISRYVFNHPIGGDCELIEFMMVALVAFGLAFTEVQDAHISVRFIADRFPLRSQLFIDIFVFFLMVVMLAFLVWQNFDEGVYAFQVGDRTDILRIPLFICKFFIPIGFLIWLLEVGIKLWRSLSKVKIKNRSLLK